MSYQVLARKWRPANFTQMVGQEHVLQALVNALTSQRLHHAYLFSGTRGVGKTTIARIFAKSLNCEQGISAEPCGECSSCREIDQGRSVDLIEIDAASRTGVDDMRELLDNVQYAPTRSSFKIYLIDEVHMLSKHSFNALLKTLEEPPPHVKFLLATTDPQKLPVTVLSRCLQFNLKRMSRAQLLAQLTFLTEQEGIEADESALVQLANAADGSMRDALSLLDQAIGYGGGAVRLDAVEAMLGSISRDYLAQLLDALAARQAADLVSAARRVIEHNPDYQRICAEMMSLLQQVALYQSDPRLVLEDEFSVETIQNYAGQWSPEEVQLYYQILLQGRQDLLICPDAAAGFEMLMLRLIAFSPSIEGADAGNGVKNNGVKKKTELNPVSAAAHAEAAAAADDLPQSAHGEVALTEPAAGRPAAVAAPASVKPGPEPVTEAAAADAAQNPAEAARGAPGNGIEHESKQGPAGAFDWPQLAYELGLAGMAQELVANSECFSYTNDRLELRLPRELHELVNDMTRAEILRALQQKLGVSLRLQFSSADTPIGTTPLQVKTERLRIERLAAIDAIREDAMVRKLQHAFAAELDEASVVKSESKRQ